MTRHDPANGGAGEHVGTCDQATSDPAVVGVYDDLTGDALAHQVWLELTLLLEPLRRLAERRVTV